MAQNKVQYQRGLSMPEFFDNYGLPEQCEALVRNWRWPEGRIAVCCERLLMAGTVSRRQQQVAVVEASGRLNDCFIGTSTRGRRQRPQAEASVP